METSVTLRETIEIFEEQWKLNGITVRLNIQNAPQIVSNGYLVQLLFSNLIKNATKYNITGGFIELELSENFFRITNSGQKQALPGAEIFRRFYKKGEQDGSLGLGLAIAKRICELLKFSIAYHFQPPDRHSFIVSFKEPSQKNTGLTK